ncbi:hypothetical protein CU663_26605 [Pseudomonas syringae pv. actinidifoliorum]|nr:hypothetical protein [Pseudomonas syringae pv. actinidifoliorum]
MHQQHAAFRCAGRGPLARSVPAQFGGVVVGLESALVADQLDRPLPVVFKTFVRCLIFSH